MTTGGLVKLYFKEIISVKKYLILTFLCGSVFVMKTKNKLTLTELAALCGVHFDTLYKAKKKGYCSQRLATILFQITGISRSSWLAANESNGGNPWDRVIKKATNGKVTEKDF